MTAKGDSKKLADLTESDEWQKSGVVPNPDDTPQPEGVVPNPDDPPADEEGDS